MRYVPLTLIEVETVRFDTQKMQNPEIVGIEYQQGELAGYEVREYLLEKFHHQCAYCHGLSNDPRLEVEHYIPRYPKHGPVGTDRVSNLTIACETCNKAKDNYQPDEWLVILKHSKKKIDQVRAVNFEKVKAQLKQPLADAAAVNSIRKRIGEGLKKLGIPVLFWSGGRTKWNRKNQNYPKTHWIDAACVGESGARVKLKPTDIVLRITAVGRGSRQMCLVDKHGFPRTSSKSAKRVYGFQTGDMVRLMKVTGKHQGVYIGKVVVRTRGDFDITAEGRKKITANWKCFTLLQRFDGYAYRYTA